MIFVCCLLLLVVMVFFGRVWMGVWCVWCVVWGVVYGYSVCMCVFSGLLCRRPCALDGCFLDLAVLWEGPVPLIDVTLTLPFLGRRGIEKAVAVFAHGRGWHIASKRLVSALVRVSRLVL